MRIIAATLLALTAFAASAFRVDTLSVPTKYLDEPMKVCVAVPDVAATQRVPSVYLLHGFDGNNTNWVHKAPLADRFGVIIVMPDARNTWYWDSPVNPGIQMESAITKDLVPYIDGHYPTIACRSRRAISGLSMGGHGALWLSSRHPDIWGSAASMSGGVDIAAFPRKWDMGKMLGPQEENPKRWDEHSVLRSCVPALKKAGLNLLIDCGNDDFFAGVNEQLHRRLLEEKIPHDYISRPGAHTWDYWNNSVVYHLTFFSEAFRK